MQYDTAAAIVCNILNGLKCTTVSKLEWGTHTSTFCYHHHWDFVKLLINKNSCVCRERRKRMYLQKKKFIVTLMGHFKTFNSVNYILYPFPTNTVTLIFL